MWTIDLENDAVELTDGRIMMQSTNDEALALHQLVESFVGQRSASEFQQKVVGPPTRVLDKPIFHPIDMLTQDPDSLEFYHLRVWGKAAAAMTPGNSNERWRTVTYWILRDELDDLFDAFKSVNEEVELN